MLIFLSREHHSQRPQHALPPTETYIREALRHSNQSFHPDKA